MNWTWKKEFMKSYCRYYIDKLFILLNFLRLIHFGWCEIIKIKFIYKILMIDSYTLSFKYVFRYYLNYYRKETAAAKDRLESDLAAFNYLIKLETYMKEKE